MKVGWQLQRLRNLNEWITTFIWKPQVKDKHKLENLCLKLTIKVLLSVIIIYSCMMKENYRSYTSKNCNMNKQIQRKISSLKCWDEECVPQQSEAITNTHERQNFVLFLEQDSVRNTPQKWNKDYYYKNITLFERHAFLNFIQIICSTKNLNSTKLMNRLMHEDERKMTDKNQTLKA